MVSLLYRIFENLSTFFSNIEDSSKTYLYFNKFYSHFG